MRKRLLSLVLIVLLIVGAPFMLGGATANNQGKRSLDGLKAALQQVGFTVPQQDGELTAVDVTPLCCSGQIPGCEYNNYGEPYMTLDGLPKVPGEAELPYPYTFHLGPNEALILAGRTPPPMAYFSYDVYVNVRYRTLFTPQDGNFTVLGAYTGDAVNSLTIHTSGPPNDPFNREMLLIITADRQVEARVREAARRAGYPSSWMNTLVIPATVVYLGVDDQADTLQMLHRTAIAKDPDALARYEATPQPVLRVTLEDPAWEPDPIPVPRLRVHGTGQSEMELLPDVESLRQAILAQNPGFQVTEVETEAFRYQGFTSVQTEQNGFGPTSDSLYVGSSGTFMLPTPDSFAVMYGVNHQVTGKATYSSLNLYEDEIKLGLVSANSQQDYPGSAEEYLTKSYPNVASLFAFKVAWQCKDGEKYCVALQDLDLDCNALNLTYDSPFKVWFRLYLEPTTMTGPDFREIVNDRVMLFTP